VGLEHLPRCSTTLDGWGRADEVVSLKLRFRRKDVLFGKIRPYFHKVAMAPFDGVCSSDAIVIRAKAADFSGVVLALVSSDRFVAHAVQTSNGTKMPRANWNVLKKYPVPRPPDAVLTRANEAFVGWAELACALQSANVRLAASRDLLLPRLISGKLSVLPGERELEDAA
jgi:type I restriction enzyme S subunit